MPYFHTTMADCSVDCKVSPDEQTTDVGVRSETGVHLNENSAPVQTKDGQCSFYILRKKRFCRFPSHTGQKYCAEHALAGGVELKRKRVQCPLNPKHTCYEDSLDKHVRKCLKISKNTNPYFQEGINAGDMGNVGEVSKEDLMKTVKNATREEILDLIERVNRLHAEHVGEIVFEELTHGSLESQLAIPDFGFKVIRQRKQQASLIGHLERMGFLKDGLCFAELGAGRGQLSHWVQLALETCNNSSFLLVDKGTCRYKYDSYHRGEHQGPTFERMQVNLADINLGKVASIIEGSRPVLGMGKHLCGGATDLALRCLTETLSLTQSDDQSTKRASLAGVVISLCCHHRCTWQSYVGKHFLSEKCALSVSDFYLLCSMTSWATCAWEGWKKHVKPKDEKSKLKENVNKTEKESGVENNSREITPKEKGKLVSGSSETNSEKTISTPEDDDSHFSEPMIDRHELGLTAEEKQLIGRKCKQLVDKGRVLYLQEKGMTSFLKAYIDESYTPENIVLLARPIEAMT